MDITRVAYQGCRLVLDYTGKRLLCKLEYRPWIARSIRRKVKALPETEKTELKEALEKLVTKTATASAHNLGWQMYIRKTDLVTGETLYTMRLSEMLPSSEKIAVLKGLHQKVLAVIAETIK